MMMMTDEVCFVL